jgi:type II secretory pathway pseudopilin PulG
MNLPSFHASRITHHASRSAPRPRRQSGSAVIVVLALLSIILVYVAGNLRTLTSLDRELQLLERQQIRRLQTATQKTNTPPSTVLGTNSVPKSGTNSPITDH